MKKLLCIVLAAFVFCAVGCTGPKPEARAGIEIIVELAVEPAVSSIKADFWQGDKLVLTEDILPAGGGAMAKNKPFVFDIDPQQLAGGTVDIGLSLETEDGLTIEFDPIAIDVDYEQTLHVRIEDDKGGYFAVFDDDVTQNVGRIAKATGAAAARLGQ